MEICPKHGIERNKNYQCSECRREYGQSQAKKDSDKRYSDSEKGKAAELRYRNSERAQLTRLKYRSTEKAKEANRLHNKRYYYSEKGEIQRQQEKFSGRRLAINRKYQTSEKAKETKRQRALTLEGKLKLQARDCVNKIIRQGKLIRLPCLVCGSLESEAHHAWGYEKEHRLHVIFLCIKHHRQADRNPLFNEEIKSKTTNEKSPLRD